MTVPTLSMPSLLTLIGHQVIFKVPLQCLLSNLGVGSHCHLSSLAWMSPVLVSHQLPPSLLSLCPALPSGMNTTDFIRILKNL